MAGRWRDPTAFRADPGAADAVRPSRRQAVALLAVLLLVAGATTLVSYLVRPDRARSFDLFHGSLYLRDSVAPVAVDLATGRPTVRLTNAQLLVGVSNVADVRVVPLAGETLLLNPASGEFNMVDPSGLVIKSKGGGVTLPPVKSPAAMAVASGSSAYIVQTSTTGTRVYLVGAATVERVAQSRGAVKPRASIAMPDTASTDDPGSAASADGALWMLVGPAQSQTIRELTVPADSSAGAGLIPTDRGTVVGTAAIATARSGGSTVVGVASATGVQVFRGDKMVATARFPRPHTLTRILPVSNGGDRLSFLLSDGVSWKLASVGADGTLLRALDVTGLPADAVPVAPAASNGRLYTLDTTRGVVVSIDGSGHASTLAQYPLGRAQVDKSATFKDASVTARASRVIVNSSSHKRALVIFTDGTRPPLPILKQSAVTVNAAGGVLALTQPNAKVADTPNKAPSKSTGGTKPPRETTQPVSTSLDCKNASTQTPHQPVIVDVNPASRSAYVKWTYALTDPADCQPSTYQLTIRQIGNASPDPRRSTLVVEGQDGTNVGGLFPDTKYEIQVRAFINNTGGEPSEPAPFATTAEGPAAPKKVVARTDTTGNWTVTWSSCGTVKSGCVAASTWKVIPEFCDGRGLSSPPDPIQVGADPTAVEQPPATLAGGDALLGRGLRFQVEGIGALGTVGPPSAFTACTYSWRPPVTADITISASTPPGTATSQDTSRTTVLVRLAHGSVHDLGGVGGSLTYKLLDSNGGVVTSAGPTASLSQTLTGIQAGKHFRVAVVVTPPRHPQAARTVGPVDVRPAIADFPVPTVSEAQVDNTSFSTGQLKVAFDFPPGTDTHGETFDLVNSTLTCGANQKTLSFSGVVPGQAMVFDGIDRFTYSSLNNTTCSVSLQLAQNRSTVTDPPLYGAALSQVASRTVPIDPPSLSATGSDFTAQWSGSQTQPQVLVTYSGADRLILASNWTMTVVSSVGGSCGSTNSPPTSTIDVSRDCIKAGGTFTVTIAYHYLLSDPRFTIPVSGTAPQPVDPNKISYSAAWNTDVTNPMVLLTYKGSEDTSTFGSFSWSEKVTSDLAPGVDCGSSTAPASSQIAIGVNLTLCPAKSPDNATTATYSVEVKFTDPVYGVTYDNVFKVDGPAPA